MKIHNIINVCDKCLSKRTHEQIQKELEILLQIKQISAESILKFGKDKYNTDLSLIRVKCIITHSINRKSLENFYFELLDHIQVRGYKELTKENLIEDFNSQFKLKKTIF